MAESYTDGRQCNVARWNWPCVKRKIDNHWAIRCAASCVLLGVIAHSARRISFGFVACVAALVVLAAPAAWGDTESQVVDVHVAVDTYLEIEVDQISVELSVADRTEETAYSDWITVLGNTRFDAELTATSDELMDGPRGGRLPFVRGEHYQGRLWYVPMLENTRGRTGKWNRNTERTFLANAGGPGEAELRVGVTSSMENTPDGGLAPADIYRGTLILTVSPIGGSAPGG